MKHKNKYRLNETIQSKGCELTLLTDEIKIKDGKVFNNGYEYKCLKCGYIGSILTRKIGKIGCSVCCGNKIIQKGINDIWTTNLELGKLLNNPEDGYLYSENSHKKINWKCKNCGEVVFNKMIRDIKNRGLSCPKCSDGISYPEKFMYNILTQLNVSFIKELNKSTLKWCDKFKYDFYIPDLNCIIEIHGLQYYGDCHKGYTNARGLIEEQNNDMIKENLAKENGIKNYIIINAQKSNLIWIKNSLLDNNHFLNLFNLSNIDWINCHEFSTKSFAKTVCDAWNEGIQDTKVLSEKFKLARSTVIHYLNNGSLLNWCNYSPFKSSKQKII